VEGDPRVVRDLGDVGGVGGDAGKASVFGDVGGEVKAVLDLGDDPNGALGVDRNGVVPMAVPEGGDPTSPTIPLPTRL
jgi:hypothetical protein